jgi:hypothetical protein
VECRLHKSYPCVLGLVKRIFGVTDLDWRYFVKARESSTFNLSEAYILTEVEPSQEGMQQSYNEIFKKELKQELGLKGSGKGSHHGIGQGSKTGFGRASMMSDEGSRKEGSLFDGEMKPESKANTYAKRSLPGLPEISREVLLNELEERCWRTTQPKAGQERSGGRQFGHERVEMGLQEKSLLVQQEGYLSSLAPKNREDTANTNGSVFRESAQESNRSPKKEAQPLQQGEAHSSKGLSKKPDVANGSHESDERSAEEYQSASADRSDGDLADGVSERADKVEQPYTQALQNDLADLQINAYRVLEPTLMGTLSMPSRDEMAESQGSLAHGDENLSELGVDTTEAYRGLRDSSSILEDAEKNLKGGLQENGFQKVSQDRSETDGTQADLAPYDLALEARYDSKWNDSQVGKGSDLEEVEGQSLNATTQLGQQISQPSTEERLGRETSEMRGHPDREIQSTQRDFDLGSRSTIRDDVVTFTSPNVSKEAQQKSLAGSGIEEMAPSLAQADLSDVGEVSLSPKELDSSQGLIGDKQFNAGPGRALGSVGAADKQSDSAKQEAGHSQGGQEQSKQDFSGELADSTRFQGTASQGQIGSLLSEDRFGLDESSRDSREGSSLNPSNQSQLYTQNVPIRDMDREIALAKEETKTFVKTIEELQKQMMVNFNKIKQEEVSITLTPSELGSVTVSIKEKVAGAGMEIMIESELESTKLRLQATSQELYDGLRKNRVEVSSILFSTKGQKEEQYNSSSSDKQNGEQKQELESRRQYVFGQAIKPHQEIEVAPDQKA